MLFCFVLLIFICRVYVDVNVISLIFEENIRFLLYLQWENNLFNIKICLIFFIYKTLEPPTIMHYKQVQSSLSGLEDTNHFLPTNKKIKEKIGNIYKQL